VPRAIGAIQCPPERDFIGVFNAESGDLNQFRKAETVVGAKTYANAGVISPIHMGYFAFVA
jgi:hypothetical protein